MMNFNLDGDIADIDIGSNNSVVTSRTDIALIDADTLVFSACIHCIVAEEVFGEDMYTAEEWKEIINHPTYSEENSCIYTIDLDYAYQYSQEKLRTILDNTGCKDFELHFTNGRKSFRYTQVSKEYKANRTADKSKTPPIGLTELKNRWVEEHPDKAFMWTEWEADDIVVCKKEREPAKYLLVALDKDVLYSLAGTHFNYYSSGVHNIDMTFFTVTEEQAMKHHYKQCLTGDPGDNVIGLHRVGPKTADKILNHCKTKEECWSAVVREYENRGRDEIDAIINMRLVSMNQLVYNEELNKWEVSLWRP